MAARPSMLESVQRSIHMQHPSLQGIAERNCRERKSSVASCQVQIVAVLPSFNAFADAGQRQLQAALMATREWGSRPAAAWTPRG